MIDLPDKLGVEFATIKAMVKIYCRAHHQKSLCSQCAAFLDYANQKLDRCPYGQQKPTCNKCPIHCYKQAERAQARAIMVYAGPRMLLSHPILAIKHLIAERKPVPQAVPEQASHRHLRKQKSPS